MDWWRATDGIIAQITQYNQRNDGENTVKRTWAAAFLIVIGFAFLIAPGKSWTASSQLSKDHIEHIQKVLQAGKELSDRCRDLLDNARKNISIAGSNFENTGIEGFRQASDVFVEAEQKFLEAGRIFDDTWIHMRNALENSDPGTARKGMSLHDTGIHIYNEGIELQKKAHGIFKVALNESKTEDRRGSTGGRSSAELNSSPDTGGNSTPQWSPRSMPASSGGASKGFPAAALIILLGTVITSIQAFRNEVVFDKFILHPWSIVRHGKRYYTLLTSGLIHADSMHLTINLMTFCFFAFILETIVGHVNFLIIYFGSLIFSAFVVTAKNGNNPSYRALGASGAIAGVIFSYILYRPGSKITIMFAPIPIPAPIFALLYVAYSYFMAKNRYDNVGHDAHLWGAISGALITMVLDPNSIAIFRSYLNL